MYTRKQIEDGEVISIHTDRPDVPDGLVCDHRVIDGSWKWVLVRPARPAETPRQARNAPRQPQAVPLAQAATPGWWSREVRWMQPKAERTPYVPAKTLQLTVGIPLAIGCGLVVSRAIHTPTGRYIGRSLLRGLIYRGVGAMTR
jgi:hypothetical protein